MEKGTNHGGFETERASESTKRQSKCSVSIVFSEEENDDALESSKEALEKQFAEKSIMR